MIELVVGSYFLLVLGIGLASHRFFRGTGEDYFLATRTIGPFLLLMSLFGTHMTAFALLGASGEAYRTGVGVFALMASSSALVVPTLFLYLGVPMWRIGKRLRLMTQAHFFRERWESDLLGLAVFVILIAFLVPYLLIGVLGGGITLNQITAGRTPEWVGSLAVCLVVLAYVTFSGLRGTVWANTFQTLVFMSLGATAFIVIVNRLGGLSEALDQLRIHSPELLILGDKIPPLELLSYTLIPLSAGMFPHIFMHWLTAQRARSFRLTIAWYPICLLLVWVPTVLLGVLGRIDFDGLTGPETNAVLVKMIEYYSPELLAGLLGAGVFAAVMSSLDSQVLAIGTMFTQDIVRHFGFHDQMSERRQVLVGRIFVGAVLLVTFFLSQVTDRSIFALGVWCFTGFAALTPLPIAALYWRRSTRWGAAASLATTALLWIYFFVDGWGRTDYSVGGSGLMPVAVILAASAAAMVVGSLLTSPPKPQTVKKFLPL